MAREDIKYCKVEKLCFSAKAFKNFKSVLLFNMAPCFIKSIKIVNLYYTF